jgi:hypothetical protein
MKFNELDNLKMELDTLLERVYKRRSIKIQPGHLLASRISCSIKSFRTPALRCLIETSQAFSISHKGSYPQPHINV